MWKKLRSTLYVIPCISDVDRIWKFETQCLEKACMCDNSWHGPILIFLICNDCAYTRINNCAFVGVLL